MTGQGSKDAMDSMWKERAAQVARHIVEEGYYIGRWDRVKHKKPIAECTKAEALRPFQDFWEALPDSPAIRQGPFFDICDLAEEYCFGTDGDEEAASRTIDTVADRIGPKEEK